jgi:3-oxoacyl-[acyl-carrier protein] reductase
MLAGRIAVVTGAGRGIGAATAKLLAQHGAAVVVNDVSAAPAAAVVGEIEAAGGQALAFPGSVVEDGFAEAITAAAAAHEPFGAPGSIDILVNNAGFTWDGMLHKMSDEQWDAILEVHATTPFKMIRAAAPYMREAGKREVERGERPRDRSIINISSVSGLHGAVGQANYASGKTAVLGLTRTVAKEWGALGVRCNAVAFGWIDTRMTQSLESAGEDEDVRIGEASATIRQGMPDKAREAMTSPAALRASIPLARIGTPEEAAGGVVMMASPLASYVSGTCLEVTGGMGI